MSDSPLTQFIQQFQQAWISAHQHLPLTARIEESPAVTERFDEQLRHWQPKPIEINELFSNVEQALELTLYPSLAEHYGQCYAADLPFSASFGDGELLQLWSEEDLPRLQENLIGHLLMKQKLKQPATAFIGVIENSEQMIVLDNSDGSVWLEIPGDVPHQQLAENLGSFYQQLQPRVCWPETDSYDEQAPAKVPGLGARMWTMLRYLWPKR